MHLRYIKGDLPGAHFILSAAHTCGSTKNNGQSIHYLNIEENLDGLRNHGINA